MDNVIFLYTILLYFSAFNFFIVIMISTRFHCYEHITWCKKNYSNSLHLCSL